MSTLQQQARALGDPTRHAVFRHIADATAPVGVAELTERFAFNHNAIRQHLAKLVDAGLVIETTAPANGPGRPRLVYAVDPAAAGQWGTTGPYERLSRLLADIITTGRSPEEVGRHAAAEFQVPTPSGDAIADMTAAMASQGFVPEIRPTRGGTEIVLHNCPFESTARAARDTVCSLHLGIAEGLADGTSIVVDELVGYDPRRAKCRLRVHVADPGQPATEATLSLRGRSTQS
jgi:predicted ArsR family transcriptional regulator